MRTSTILRRESEFAKNLPDRGMVFHACLWNLLYAGGPEHLVQPAAQRARMFFRKRSRPTTSLRQRRFSPSGLNFGTPVLGTGALTPTTVSFTAFDPHAPAQYVQQWNASVQKSLGHDTSLEIGYIGSRGFHLQRAALDQQHASGAGTARSRVVRSRHLLSCRAPC